MMDARPTPEYVRNNVFSVYQTVVQTDGCNFGTVNANSHNETSVAVENVVQLAEARHLQTVVNLTDSANQEHQRQMAFLAQEAQNALQLQSEMHTLREQHLQQEALRHSAQLAATEAVYNVRLQQLELANAQLQEKENNRAEMVSRAWGAHHSQAHSSPNSAQDLDNMSVSGSMRSQPGFLASLPAIANPFANTFGNLLKGPASQNTCDVTTPGIDGSQSSTAYPYPTNLAGIEPPEVSTLGQRSGTQTYTVQPQTQTQSSGNEDSQPPNVQDSFASARGPSQQSPPPRR